MSSRRSRTLSLGDLVFERPKKFILGDQGRMGGGVGDVKSTKRTKLG